MDEKGDCYPCSALVRPDCRLGNLLEEPFDVVYRERGVKGLRQRVTWSPRRFARIWSGYALFVASDGSVSEGKGRHAVG